MSEILQAGGLTVGPSIIDAAWTLGPWQIAPDYIPQVHEKLLPDHGKPPSLLPSEIFDSSITSHVDRLLPDDGVGRNVHIDPTIIHNAVATYLNTTDIQLEPYSPQQMAGLERRLDHRVKKFEAAAGMSYEDVLASPTLQAELSPKEKGLFHRAEQMDLRLTGAHIETIAHNQEVALQPQEPMEWDTHALADFQQNGRLDASYFGLIHGSAPDGEPAPLLTAYKPSFPSLKVLDDVQKAIRDGMSPLWLAGMPFAAVIGDRRLPPWKRAMMATALLATTLYACSPIVPNNPGAPTPHGTLPPPGSTALAPIPSVEAATVTAPATLGSPQESYVGLNPQELVAAPGELPGAGGQEGGMTPATLTDALHKKLLVQGYAPVIDPATNTYALIGGTGADKNVTCFSSTRDQIFGPRPELAVHPLRGVENGVALFTDPSGRVAERTVMNVSLVGAPEGATCIQAFNNNPNSPDYAALKLLLIAQDGTILGTIPTFSGDDTVEVRWSDANGPQLYVNGKKSWFASSTGETLATVMPLPSPTFTSEPTLVPSATPEIMPTSCLDKDAVQTVVNSYLELKGKADLIAALQAHVDKYGGISTGVGRDKTNTYALGMGYNNVPILGEFEITLENGTGYCTVVAVPVTNVQKKVISVNILAMFTDATINGTYSGSLMPYYTEDPNVARKFVADHVASGAPVNAAFDLVDNNNEPLPSIYSLKNRSVLADIARNSYAWRFGGDLKKLQEVAGSITWPDPMKIVASLDPTKEVGLLSSGILEHK